MRPHRGNAITAGVLLIGCTAATILSVMPLGSLLDSPVNLAGLAAAANRVVAAALIDFVAAACGVGIAVALYPVVRPHNPALAMGSVVARLAAGVLWLMGTLALLSLFTLGEGTGAAGSPGTADLQAATSLLLAVRTWAPLFLSVLAFQLGAAMYYWLMYRGRLVPRWLAGWGLAATALSLVATLHTALTSQDFGMGSLETVLNIPILLQELVLAGWLIARGFTPPAPAPGPEQRPALLTTIGRA